MWINSDNSGDMLSKDLWNDGYDLTLLRNQIQTWIQAFNV